MPDYSCNYPKSSIFVFLRALGVLRGEKLLLEMGALQAMRTVQLGEIPIEGAERQMTGFAGNFQNEAIGETQ